MISEPGSVASVPGDTAFLPAAVLPGRTRDLFQRLYGAGMVVRFDGRRWEIDAVEFWRHDQKLHLRELDGAGRVRTREEWARNVEFEADEEPSRITGAGLEAALGDLSMALGNPCLDWSACASIEEALIRYATERFREQASAQRDPATGGHEQ